MGRPLRVDVGGYVYHVLNRANARMAIFEDEVDYRAFERIMLETSVSWPRARQQDGFSEGPSGKI